MVRTATAALLSVLMFASAAHAEPPSPGANNPAPAPGIRASIDAARFDPIATQSYRPIAPRRRNGLAQKITAGVAVGILGMLAGGVVGAAVGAPICRCGDEAGLPGAMIAAPIGAVLGAIAGVKLASR